MWEYLQEMLTGPGSFRFIIQPLVAILVGLRDAKLDVAAGKPPFVLSLFQSRGWRNIALGALKQIALPLAVAIVLDGVLQFVIFGNVRLYRAVIVGTALIAFPYSLSRGLFNRVITRLRLRHA